MSEEPEAISSLQLWQFSLSYDELPYMEDKQPYEDNRIYRSRKWGRLVFVHHSPDKWDCFVWRP